MMNLPKSKTVVAELALLFCKASFAAALLLSSACATDQIFPDVGDNIASPLNITIDSATNRLYLVNSNNKVLYRNASLQVYNITAPTAPAIVGTAKTDSFSGHSYYDAANNYIYLTNRYSSGGNQDLEDNIYRVNINEASADFLAVEPFSDGSNPFGMTYDAISANVYVAAYNSAVDYFPRGTPSSMTSVSVANLTMSDGSVLEESNMRDIAIVGRMAFITRPLGGLLVFDLDENNVDYFVNDFLSPRAVITDETSTNIYMTDVEDVNGYVPSLYIIDPTLFSQISGNTTVTLKSKDDAGVVKKVIQVGSDSDADPQEIAISINYIFITNTGNNSVSVINRADFSRGSDITVGNQPFGMGVYSPGGTDTYLYVTNIEDNTISIINISTLSVETTYP